LYIYPSSVSSSGSVFASTTGWPSSCSGRAFSIRQTGTNNARCAGTTYCSGTLGSSGSGSCSFTAPSTSGTYELEACVDKNQNGRVTDFSEQSLPANLQVSGTSATSGARITTDKTTYVYNDYIKYQFSGFTPGDSVHIEVLGIGTNVGPQNYVTASSSGSGSGQMLLGTNIPSFSGSVTVRATDQHSKTASTTVTLNLGTGTSGTTCSNNADCAQACSSSCPANTYGCCSGCNLGQCVSGHCSCIQATAYCSSNPPRQVGSPCISGSTTSNNVRLDKITVSWLDINGNPRQTWDVYNNGATGQTPTIPTWSSGNDFTAGNMRINYDFTNTGSSPLSLSVSTQTHGKTTGQNGGTISTSSQSIGAGVQAHQAHWIRMWSESITEDNNILISGSANGPSFSFDVNNGIPSSSGTDPCDTAGQCWPDTSCNDPNNIQGFCVPRNFYDNHRSWFQELNSPYSCGSNFCLVANANDNGCWNTRGFCYSYDRNSLTGCRGSLTLTDECQSRGGNICSQTAGRNAAIVDPSTAYGPVWCQGTGQTTSSSSSGTSSSSTPPTTSSSTPPTTSSSTQPPTSTSSTTTTPVTIQPLPLSCSLCSANSPCYCSISSSSCNNGFWSVQNLFGTPLPQINITTIPPYIVYYFPNETGTVNATANCFDIFPNNRSNSTLVTVLNPFLSCPQTCTANAQCTCTLNNCNSGLFLAVFNNSAISIQPFATNPYSAAFIPTQTGNVTAIATCDSPLLPSAKASIQVVSGTTTTSTSTTPTSVVPGSFTHSNFVCTQLESKWICTITFNNQLGQQAFLFFDVTQTTGKLIQSSKPIPMTPGSGVSQSAVFDCVTIQEQGSYLVSFKVYQTETRNTLVDWSHSSEVQRMRC